MELNDIVAAAVDLLAYALHVDNIEVDCYLAAELPTLWADPHQLQQESSLQCAPGHADYGHATALDYLHGDRCYASPCAADHC